ncbi:MAG: hypothetical protein ACRYGM_05240 [Janthinobacterium lividum]
MSDTTIEAPDLLAGALASMKVEQVMANGVPTEAFRVQWGEGVAMRSLEVKAMTLGDQLDFAETTPPGANAMWTNMAMTAASVLTVDGVPLPMVFTKEIYKRKLDRLGLDGLRAAMMVLNGYRGPDDAAKAPQPPDTTAMVGN